MQHLTYLPQKTYLQKTGKLFKDYLKRIASASLTHYCSDSEEYWLIELPDETFIRTDKEGADAFKIIQRYSKDNF